MHGLGAIVDKPEKPPKSFQLLLINQTKDVKWNNENRVKQVWVACEGGSGDKTAWWCSEGRWVCLQWGPSSYRQMERWGVTLGQCTRRPANNLPQKLSNLLSPDTLVVVLSIVWHSTTISTTLNIPIVHTTSPLCTPSSWLWYGSVVV